MPDITQASGWNSLEDSPLGRRKYARTIAYNYHCDGIFSLFANSEYNKEIDYCNQELQFVRSFELEFMPYEKNETGVTQNATPDAFCFRICDAAYIRVKVDELDERFLCERWAMWKEMFDVATTRAWDRLLSTDVMKRLPFYASPTNKGATAGAKSGNVNLGAPGAPVIIDSNNIVSEIAKLNQVLTESCAWQKGKMILLMPPSIGPVLMDSKLANALQMGACVDCSPLMTGEWYRNMMGWDFVITNYQCTGFDATANRSVFYVTALNRDALLFGQNLIITRTRQGDGFYKLLEVLGVWGHKPVHPDGFAIGYWSVGA